MSIVALLRAAGCVFAEEEAELILEAAADASEAAAMAERRAGGVPLEVVVGWAGFCGLRIAVEPGVFVPRRRTEFLAEQAAALLPPGAVALDLCCGAGAIGASLLAAGAAELHAADVDPAAVRCARRNLEPLGGRVYEGDLYEPLPRGLHGRIDVIAANVPYVPTGEIALLPAEARDHEPHGTLDGGRDGLGVLRRVASGAVSRLAPGGSLLSETSERQAPAARAAFAAAGLAARLVADEERGATIVIGTRPRR